MHSTNPCACLPLKMRLLPTPSRTREVNDGEDDEDAAAAALAWSCTLGHIFLSLSFISAQLPNRSILDITVHGVRLGMLFIARGVGRFVWKPELNKQPAAK